MKIKGNANLFTYKIDSQLSPKIIRTLKTLSFKFFTKHY